MPRHRDDTGAWAPGTWRPSLRADGAQYPRHSLLVVGHGPVASRLIAHAARDPRVVLAGPCAPPEDAVEAVRHLRPDFALLCGADAVVLECVVAELAEDRHPPPSRVVAVRPAGPELQYLAADALAGGERAVLDGLTRWRTWSA